MMETLYKLGFTDINVLTNYEIAARLLGAIIASGLIGYERERKGHEAGLRTHMLVATGSCVFAIIQMKTALRAAEMSAHSEYLAKTLGNDMSRIIAQVVSGVGFLGAGTIIINKRRVRGLTTAASIWATAALGVGFGMGYFFAMTMSSLVILGTLALIKKIFRTPIPLSFEIVYIEQPELSEKVREFFHKKKISIMADHYYYQMKDGVLYHRNHYIIDSSLIGSKTEFFEELFDVGNILEIKSLYIQDDSL